MSHRFLAGLIVLSTAGCLASIWLWPAAALPCVVEFSFPDGANIVTVTPAPTDRVVIYAVWTVGPQTISTPVACQ